jgi:hypothetical protein
MLCYVQALTKLLNDCIGELQTEQQWDSKAM